MTELERLQRIRDFWMWEADRIRWADGDTPNWRLSCKRVVRASAAVRRHSGAAAARVGPRS
jgi:hypothetical protein